MKPSERILEIFKGYEGKYDNDIFGATAQLHNSVCAVIAYLDEQAPGTANAEPGAEPSTPEGQAK